jgi:AcrR family transcriptional regulator
MKKPTKQARVRRVSAAGDPAEVSPRIARRERRRERSREEIVEAARRVLVRNGISGTTLDAVAAEIGVTKAALYYYYPSKEVLFFEVIFGAVEAQANAIHAAVESAPSGAAALRAIIRETVQTFAPRIDDFRLAFLHNQVVKPGTVRLTADQFARLRPLNDRSFAGATKRLVEEWKVGRGRANVEPRLLAFLANAAAIGVLTMKGLVESFGDPLLYSDEQLIEGFARVFEAAAAPPPP